MLSDRFGVPPISSFTARPVSFTKEVVSAHGAAPLQRDAVHFVSLARGFDTALGIGMIALGVEVGRTSEQRDERALAAVVVLCALFLLGTGLVPNLCCCTARLQQLSRSLRASLRSNFAFFFDSGLRGHTHLLFSVGCFPLGRTNGVVLGMLLMASALFSWWMHCTRKDAFAVADDGPTRRATASGTVSL